LRYVPRGIAEDVRYLAEMLRGGATLTRIVDPSSYICVRHSGNSTPALDTTKPGWEQVELSAYLTPEAQLFYGQFKGVSSRDT